MKNKNLFIMIAVFAVLLIFYFATSYKPREVKEGAVPLFAGAKPIIDRLEIVRATGDSIVIEKQNAVWTVTSPFEYKANETYVNQAVEKLTGISIDGVVSSRAETQDRYSTGTSTGIHIKASSGGGIVLDAVIGKINDDYTHTFARLADSDETSLWRGAIAVLFNREPDEWRDKNVLSLNSAEITNISVSGDSADRELAFNGTEWTYTDSGAEKPVDHTKVNNIATMLATLSCDSFADEDETALTESAEPDAAVSITLKNGRIIYYRVWKAGEGVNRYLVRLDGNDIVFGFSNYRGEQLMIDYERIKAPENETA
ncbi:DUF4340 domain-containing protein [Candidatus Latescibacterota bacterium]